MGIFDVEITVQAYIRGVEADTFEEAEELAKREFLDYATYHGEWEIESWDMTPNLPNHNFVDANPGWICADCKLGYWGDVNKAFLPACGSEEALDDARRQGNRD